MRILGFSEEWKKLKAPEFTTFRFLRKDKDWQIGEIVQIALKPRTPGRVILGTAEIVAKEARWTHFRYPLHLTEFPIVSNKEAIADGFDSLLSMQDWLWTHYHYRIHDEAMNKLTLKWLERTPL